MADAPKLDLKMLIVPGILFMGRSIDYKSPEVSALIQNAFIAVVVLCLTIYYVLYMTVNSKKEDTKIWVPPKPKPSLPFGLGPPPEPIKIEDFEETTYREYEIRLIKEGVQSTATSGGISYLMSMKFGPMSQLIQSVMMPVNLAENVVLKKHFLGIKQAADGTPLYKELFEPPTAAIVAALNASMIVGAATPADEEPRVVELPADDDGDKKKEKKKEDAKKKKDNSSEVKNEKTKSTSAADID
mmetsp:Transcript_16336/g.27601  ORF Transcript_16336/g.27601 Transcript_16336/m.27601 type:complete len:243 (+) Transcript_16336:94-822(+)|eukprot:CAMPEP_0174989728 /NCGR_PEP_ID=MMETSP0004_2-20121128/20898_1 /TAXON_ID=420556 /ORGANISM="Ochromonas sp., Strain CCMP1393" /LENGTH=242 /DNA_ID=CAMNT_0016243199 /DNA_START=82 /DNA_END=810 /DNA_ORIENTATION=+